MTKQAIREFRLAWEAETGEPMTDGAAAALMDMEADARVHREEATGSPVVFGGLPIEEQKCESGWTGDRCQFPLFHEGGTAMTERARAWWGWAVVILFILALSAADGIIGGGVVR